MAKDRFKIRNTHPSLAWVGTGVLLTVVIALLAVYMLRPGRSPADDARTAAAVGDMDVAQQKADERREEKRSSAALLN